MIRVSKHTHSKFWSLTSQRSLSEDHLTSFLDGYTTTEEQELYDDAVPADKQANLSSSKPAARLNIQNKPPPPGKPVFLTKKTGFPEKPTTEGTKTSQSSSVSELKARLEKVRSIIIYLHAVRYPTMLTLRCVLGLS